MTNTRRGLTLGVIAVLTLSVIGGTGALASTNALSAMQSDETPANVTATPNSPGSTATHTTTVPVGSDAAGSSWNSYVVEYTETDVSNVGQGDITTIGIDRGNDDPGTAVDVNVSDDVSEVSASDNGRTLTIGLGGNYDLQQGDQLVVEYQDATNPGTAGNYTVQVTVNHQSAAETSNGTLVIESTDDGGNQTTDGNQTDDGGNQTTDGNQTDDNQTTTNETTTNETTDNNQTTTCDCSNRRARITFDRQQTDGETATVQSVTLSDGGYVVITDESGEVIGRTDYLAPGTHENVTVQLDEPISSDQTLTATAYQDANGDQTFDEADCPYTDGQGDPVSDDACVTVCEENKASERE